MNGGRVSPVAHGTNVIKAYLNEHMYINAALQENLDTLFPFRFQFTLPRVT